MSRTASIPHAPRCVAHNHGGQPCKNWAMHGSTVCRMHGGASAQVRAKARERLDDMVDPALAQLRKLLTNRSGSVSLNAVKDVLDRTGYKLPERIESDNATTIRVEYEQIEMPIVSPVTAERERQSASGGHTNGTSKHD